MFFDSWPGLSRVIIVGVLAYAGLVAMLRISGKRLIEAEQISGALGAPPMRSASRLSSSASSWRR